MEPKFQTSFIPQKPTASGGGFSSPSASTHVVQVPNIFSTIATIIFVLSLVACGGLFAYKQYLTSQISQQSSTLTQTQNSFDFGTIQNLIAVSVRIGYATQLLNAHVAVSELFNLLQSLTVPQVSFSNFSYNNKGTELDVSMNGEAQGYDVLTAQANIFSQNSFIKNPTFSDFDLATNGDVTFKFSAIIDPTLVSYKQAIAALSPVAATAVVTSSSTPTQ